jgi:hypothetical protein
VKIKAENTDLIPSPTLAKEIIANPTPINFAP